MTKQPKPGSQTSKKHGAANMPKESAKTISAENKETRAKTKGK